MVEGTNPDIDQDIAPNCDIICDICGQAKWAGPVYISTTYRPFVCGCRLCEDCQAVVEAVLDELAGRKVSQQMRAENWVLAE